MNPAFMGLSYVATWVSTSAIIGFGGVSGVLGMGMLWLPVLNIFIGILIAFALFGTRTRALGRNLGAHTFAELLGKRFQSKKIQIIAGIIIFLAMPLYASAVIIGIARFAEETFMIDFNIAIFIFAFAIAVYVFIGGLKGVMYTDCFQGCIVLAGLLLLVIFTYSKLGGIVKAHQSLTDLAEYVPLYLREQGHTGWTSMPLFDSKIWWTMISTMVLGVGVGVLAQPQLVVRYMTVRSNKDIYRAIGIAAVVLYGIVFSIYTVGPLSNVFFFEQSGNISLQMTVNPYTGLTNSDQIMPLFIKEAMPSWFGYIFLLVLLAAAMSTISSLFHTIGASISRDIFEHLLDRGDHHFSLLISRVGILAAFSLTLFFAYHLPGSIIALATSLFFGLCAACFLPAYCGALFSRYMNSSVAIASMFTGFITWGFWIVFIHDREASAFGICRLLFGTGSLFEGTRWSFIDPLLIALPFSSLVACIGTLYVRHHTTNDPHKLSL